MNKKGFTLVELMVVIVIIGILAAVAIPRMMAAADRARAAEGPSILATLVNLQHAFRAERDWFVNCAVTTLNVGGTPAAVSGGWQAIGLDTPPNSRFYTFEIATAGGPPAVAPNLGIDGLSFGDTFIGTAQLGVRIGGAAIGQNITVNQVDARTASSHDINNLLPNWRGTVTP